MSDEACMVISTASSEAEAGDIARAVLAARLAACVQILPVTSHYWWDGRMEAGAEHLMLFKARTADYPALEAAIRERHSYDVPEIIRVPILAGSPDYLAWLRRETRRP